VIISLIYTAVETTAYTAVIMTSNVDQTSPEKDSTSSDTIVTGKRQFWFPRISLKWKKNEFCIYLQE